MAKMEMTKHSAEVIYKTLEGETGQVTIEPIQDNESGAFYFPIWFRYKRIDFRLDAVNSEGEVIYVEQPAEEKSPRQRFLH